MLIFENDFFRITARDSKSKSESGSVLLSFSGVGFEHGAGDVQKQEFFGAGRSFDNIIFIIDKKRSWGNSLQFRSISEMIAPYIGDRKIHSIGNSMGGFNAIISTFFMPTKTCTAIVPQYSASPSIVPWEDRWYDYRSKIKRFRFETVEKYMNNTTKYFIFSGNIGLDRRHAKLFPVKKNIHHYSFLKLAHNVSQTLKERGLLDQAVQGCFNGNEDLPQDWDYVKLSPPAAVI